MQIIEMFARNFTAKKNVIGAHLVSWIVDIGSIHDAIGPISDSFQCTEACRSITLEILETVCIAYSPTSFWWWAWVTQKRNCCLFALICRISLSLDNSIVSQIMLNIFLMFHTHTFIALYWCNLFYCREFNLMLYMQEYRGIINNNTSSNTLVSRWSSIRIKCSSKETWFTMIDWNTFSRTKNSFFKTTSMGRRLCHQNSPLRTTMNFRKFINLTDW